MKNILIIYGSTGGNTQLTAEKVCEVLSQKGFDVKMQAVEHSKAKDMDHPDVVILGASTYGHGIIQDYFPPFLKAMKKEKYDLKNKPCAVIGLGDPKYDAQYHIESANILEEVINKHNGRLIEPSLRVSRSPVQHLGGYIKKWAEDFAEKINNLK